MRVKEIAAHQVSRLRQSGRHLSRNDVRIILMAQVVCELSKSGDSQQRLAYLADQSGAIERAIEQLVEQQRFH